MDKYSIEYLTQQKCREQERHNRAIESINKQLEQAKERKQRDNEQKKCMKELESKRKEITTEQAGIHQTSDINKRLEKLLKE